MYRSAETHRGKKCQIPWSWFPGGYVYWRSNSDFLEEHCILLTAEPSQRTWFCFIFFCLKSKWLHGESVERACLLILANSELSQGWVQTKRTRSNKLGSNQKQLALWWKESRSEKFLHVPVWPCRCPYGHRKTLWKAVDCNFSMDSGSVQPNGDKTQLWTPGMVLICKAEETWACWLFSGCKGNMVSFVVGHYETESSIHTGQTVQSEKTSSETTKQHKTSTSHHIKIFKMANFQKKFRYIYNKTKGYVMLAIFLNKLLHRNSGCWIYLAKNLIYIFCV